MVQFFCPILYNENEVKQTNTN